MRDGRDGDAPLVMALDLDQARQRAAQAGWAVGEVIHTAPPFSQPSGVPRVIGQRVTAPRTLTLVAAAGVALACCAWDDPRHGSAPA